MDLPKGGSKVRIHGRSAYGRRKLVAVVAIAVVALGVMGADGGCQPPPDPCATARPEILRLVNQERAKVGRAPLVKSDNLDWGAQWWTDEQMKAQRMSHSDILTIATILQYANPSWLGETVAKGQQSASDVVSVWMGSTPHRAVILESRAMDLGVGCTYSATENTYYWTGQFGAHW